MAEHIDIVKKSLIRRSSDDYMLDYGKLPPQCKQLEITILGAILLESNAMLSVAKILKTEMFYVDAHQRIFSACCQLFIENQPIDLETVVYMLKKHGNLDAAGGPFYVAQLTNSIGSAANIETHALFVKEEWMKRKCIEISTVATKEAYEDTSDAREVIGTAINTLNNLIIETSQQEMKSFNQALHDKVLTIEEASQKEGDEKYVIGKPTGLYTLDRKSLGYKNTNFIIIGGRPAEGKSTLMVQGAHLCATKGIPTGIFSLEMSVDELMGKFISLETGIDSERVQTGVLKEGEHSKLHQAAQRMKDYPIFIDDMSNTLQEIEAIAKVWKAKFGVEVIYIDYLQLVEVGLDKKKMGMNREQELSMISRRFKKLAKSLEIPVIALCALSREMDKRPVADRRPKLMDLRESGAIEQDANMVIFVFRPEEHGISHFHDQSPTKGITEFIIAKNRLGPKAICRAKFIGATGKFDDSEFSQFQIEYNETSTPHTPNKTDEDLPF
jgi:replicative DNA helicase